MNPATIQAMAREEARFWAMRIPPHTDVEDLEQQAATAMLEALRTVDKKRNLAKIRNYLRQAARVHCWRLVWENAAPVTGGMHRARELRGSIDTTRSVMTLCTHETPEDLTIQARRQAALRTRLEAHARTVPHGDKVLAGLLREWLPRDIRRRFGLTRRQWFASMAALRKAIAQDVELRATLATKER
jgi:hypothetical protein